MASSKSRNAGASKKKSHAPAKRARKASKQVWEKPAPKNASHHRLAPKKKAAAKAAARRAGRPYPNLVDNIRAAAPKHAKRRKR